MKKIIALLSAVIMAASLTVSTAASAVSTEMVISPASDNNVSAIDTVGFTAEVIRLVNQERANRGLREFRMFPRLSKAAMVRAKETSEVWDHTRPDGRSITTVCDEIGIGWDHIGENIAYGHNSPQAVVSGWMRSDGHRANILSTDFQYIGVGVYESKGILYWTQYFIGTTDNHPEAYSVKDYGDVNSDGKVDAVDASLVLGDYASVMSGKSYTLSSSQRAKAEVSGDDLVNAVDASQILSLYAKSSTR
ncbi:MAG: hypothetical protein IKH96_06900 [Ruminococcus sp.]|uniref:CAP domain-containing protein n=1 Tax=Ruminococcus sp. TaxID=41978 RepID=UPI0025E20BCE|nr:CAP domain-containing protein [Ruminococcus sp.]MBR6995735.1 hypothetical protein [Ruminococcus sp.]